MSVWTALNLTERGFVMKKRLLSLLLVLAMMVSLVAGLGLTASAAAPSDVTEMTVGGNKVFVYAPKHEMLLSSTCTAPCFMVFGAAPYTAESAKAEAKESGLEALAVAEGATIVFIKNGELVEKKKLDLPRRITNVILCKNPRCITSTEQELPHVFNLTDEKHRIYRCLYCETKSK